MSDEKLPTDSEIVDWLQYMADECEGHVLTRCFMPSEELTLREKIAKMMRINPQPETK